jgi:drug/metabolite transporter (DMT)-like permease
VVTRYSLAISWSDLAVCAFVNLAFVVAMLANSYTLRYLSIHMVTLLKCCSVVVTAIGDHFCCGHRISGSYWVSLLLIVLGAMVGLATELEFSLLGCFWMVLSVLFSSGYVLLSKLLVSHRNIPFFTMVFWNNFLGTIVLTLYIFGSSQLKHKQFFQTVFSVFVARTSSFFVSPYFVLFSGAIGLLLNISTFSLLGETSATSYVVVQTFKKIVQVTLSYLLVDATPTWTNVLSVATGIAGATIYAYLKWKDQNVARLASDATLLLKRDSETSGMNEDIIGLRERSSNELV